MFNMDKFTKASFVVLFVLLFISFGFNILYVVKNKDVEILAYQRLLYRIH